MRANLLDVFNERDSDRRRAAIRRTYVVDVKFLDADETVIGHQAVDAKAERILEEAPDFVFSPGGAVYINHDLGYLAWNFGPAGAAPVVRGVDIAHFEAGRIASVYTLLLSD